MQRREPRRMLLAVLQRSESPTETGQEKMSDAHLLYSICGTAAGQDACRSSFPLKCSRLDGLTFLRKHSWSSTQTNRAACRLEVDFSNARASHKVASKRARERARQWFFRWKTDV